jgi:mannose/cellobiose epimerase-like protein (N-acyl-D-glucosamine 2-epimerase family)
MTGSWVDLPSHRAWLDTEGARLLDFAAGARLPGGGFGWLDRSGRLRPDGVAHTWITARMTHVFSLAHLRGVPGAGELADHGLAALSGRLRDAEFGGWFGAVGPEGRPVPGSDDKAAYQHAFVVLAASSATAAGRPVAADLLAEALSVMEARFWREDEGRMVESWDRGWTVLEPYRGGNSNMHAVEALTAAADVTGEGAWRRRALGIAERLVHGEARANAWRMPEHYDAGWRPLLEYNTDHPDHPFRPFGATVGHWMEWARLMVSLEGALSVSSDDAHLPDHGPATLAAGDGAPSAWLLDDAIAFFRAAVREGWAVDGRPGFVYTVGWDGRPVVRTRMHWVVAEAINAAAALHRRTGSAEFEGWYRAWWDHAADLFIDRHHGSWHHELSPENIPASSVWDGKPDVYHAYQATLFPQLPLDPSAAAFLRSRLAGHGRGA